MQRVEDWKITDKNVSLQKSQWRIYLRKRKKETKVYQMFQKRILNILRFQHK